MLHYEYVLNPGMNFSRQFERRFCVMGKLWFPVLSDFWPHGAVARKYGVLRSDGVSERALFVIDKKGIIQAIHVSDINIRPDLAWCATELEKLE
jgi:peroxiredoxin (alkyl hydroperoxide reductase subunit C)